MPFIKSSSVITSTAITVPLITGGDNGKVVRISGENTVVNASKTDTVVQLNAVLLKVDNVYYAGGVVSGLTSLAAGSPYFLDSLGNIVSTPPIPTASIRVLYLGFALNSTDLLFRPGIPISG